MYLLKCIKNVLMSYDGEQNFTKGELYLFDVNPFTSIDAITVNDLGEDHYWGDDILNEVEETFTLLSEVTIKEIRGVEHLDQIRIFRDRIIEGMTQEQLVEKYGIPRTSIRRILAQMSDVFLSEYEGLEGSSVNEIIIDDPMKEQSSFTLVPKSIINIMHLNEVYTADVTHPMFDKIVDFSVKGEFDKAIELLNIGKAVTKYSQGDVIIKDGVVSYKGMEVNDSLAKRIVSLMKEGDEGFKKYVNFMINLRMNPSNNSVKQLFDFLKYFDVEINQDGMLECWKYVRGDYLDLHTGSIENFVGNTIKMDRNLVDEDSDNTCSDGLHVCAWDYMTLSDSYHFLKCLVHPKDVVSIPSDHKDSKMRCCEYTIIEEVDKYKNHISAGRIGYNTIEVGQQGFIVSTTPKSIKLEEYVDDED